MKPRLVSTLFITALLAHHLHAGGFTFQEKPGEHLDVLHDGRVIARYITAYDTSTKAKQHDTYKPFLHVFDAEGKEPITKGPGGDFTHHRGIYIGWNGIRVGEEKFDRWHMKGGEQVHKKFLSQKADDKGASFTSQVEWMGKTAGDPIIIEERTFTFLPPPAPGYALIDMSSKLKAMKGETVLGGDTEHAGLHFRPAQEIERANTVYVFPREKADPKKDKDYPWFGESYTVKGKRFSVVYLNHPSNPKNASISAYRDYGRFGAFFTDTIPANGEKTIKARFLVAAGEMPPAEVIQKAWNEYAGANEPVPAITVRPADGAAKTPGGKKATPAPATPKSAMERTLLPLMLGQAAPKKDAAIAGVPDPGKEAAAPAPPGSQTPATTTAPAATPAGPKRAGGGPENPEIKFKLPPPKVLTAREALKTFKLPKGFKIEVVAAEPLVEAPIAMSWDDQGRAYVCEMRGYMHDVDGGGEDQPIGRISRLEDTDGDGVFDKSTIFADKLLMPRAVMALGDGALVGEPPNLTFYRDPDGDGKGEAEGVVATDFGRAGGQPEHMVNSPTWLLDNWIWVANQGVRYRWQQGKFTSESVTGGGQWGLTQDDWGRPYFNYNSDLLRSHSIPPQLYARNPNLATRTGVNVKAINEQTVWPSHPTPGVNRGYTGGVNAEGKPTGTLRPDGTLANATATCGATIYRGDLFPAEFRGNAFAPEPSGNLVKRLILSEDGGLVRGKNAYQGTEFLTSTDERFRPVNAYTGPDGALYIVDMYRGILQHKGFLTYYLVANIKARNLEQPVNLGRIYRIVPEGAKPKPVKLPKESTAIVPMLAHANGWVRDTAQRVLVERGEEAVVDAVKKVAAEGATPQARLHALWTLEGLKALTPDVITARLADKDPKVRATAIRLADRTLVADLQKLVDDPSPEVRLQLAFTLSGYPETETAVVALLQKGGNDLLGEAVASGLRGRELEFLEKLLPTASSWKAGPTNPVTILAGCVIAERRAARIAKLLDLIAAQPAGVQTALLEGMRGKPLGKGAQPKLIWLDAAPPALAQLQAKPGAKKDLLAAIDAQLAWPDKPGVPPPPKVTPLTAEQQALFEKGKVTYATVCAGCHQPTGIGMEGLAPPVAGSEWVTGPADRPVKILLHGLSGPISVAGTTWRLEMPPLPLSDDDIAAVLTYLRREWEHTASPVSPAEVAKIRAAEKGRTKAWTADDFRPPKSAGTKSKKQG